MRKIEVHDTESKSAELITENISALAALFPEAVSEDSVDMEALRELLGGGGFPKPVPRKSTALLGTENRWHVDSH